MKSHIIHHLSQDKILAAVLKEFSPQELRREENIAIYLCISIISQQLNTRVAQIICERFLTLLEGTGHSYNDILSLNAKDLRGIGLSESKTRYIYNVSAFFIEHNLNDNLLHSMSNEELTSTLIGIKGVGNWTVQMLLMFAMAREDVFAPDDLGVQKAMKKLYQLEGLSTAEQKRKMIEISRKWQPYRTHACMALWNWNDRK